MSRCGLRLIVKVLILCCKVKWKFIFGMSMEYWVSSKVSGIYIVIVKQLGIFDVNIKIMKFVMELYQFSSCVSEVLVFSFGIRV